MSHQHHAYCRLHSRVGANLELAVRRKDAVAENLHNLIEGLEDAGSEHEYDARARAVQSHQNIKNYLPHVAKSKRETRAEAEIILLGGNA